MKILLIVVLALTSYGHCEEAEETTEKYLFGKDYEISETGTNQNIPNGHGQLLTIPDAQSYQYIKSSSPTYQFQKNPSDVHINPASVPYQATYKPYPQTVAKQFTDFANLPQSNYQTSYQMIAPKEPRFFVNSPQIYEKNNLEFESNSYGSNQNKFNEQYRYKPTTWTEESNGAINEFDASGNGLQTAKRYSPVIATYGPASTNGNRFETVKEYTPVYSGYGIPSSTTTYPAGNIGASSTYMANEYRNPKMLSYGPTNVGNELKYSNVAQPLQYMKPEYKPVMVSEFGSGIVNGALTTKTSEFMPYGKPQYMYVVPKEYASTPNVNYGSHGYSRQNFRNSFMYLPKSTNGYSTEYSSVPSFESSLRDIVKMVNEEQRKSNGKAIFLMGKPQISQHMLSNMVGYSSSSSQQVPLRMLSNLRGYAAPSSEHGSNINAFSGYKY